MTTTVQARIDEQVRDEASKVLERWGLSVSDAVRILLTRTAREGRLPIELLSTSAEHDEWFRRQVSLALKDEQEIDDDTVESEFAERRSKARAVSSRHNKLRKRAN
jgi:DNA-damage-inducible protein J